MEMEQRFFHITAAGTTNKHMISAGSVALKRFSARSWLTFTMLYVYLHSTRRSVSNYCATGAQASTGQAWGAHRSWWTWSAPAKIAQPPRTQSALKYSAKRGFLRTARSDMNARLREKTNAGRHARTLSAAPAASALPRSLQPRLPGQLAQAAGTDSQSVRNMQAEESKAHFCETEPTWL